MPFVITRLAAGVAIGGLCVAVLLLGCGSGGNTNGSGNAPAPTPTPTPTPSAANEWTWMSGSNAVPLSYQGPAGVYGTVGVASSANTPGARSGAASWADGGGNLWLFGGIDPNGYGGQFNDLWEFNIAAKTWTWVSGAQTVTANGVYGSLGVAASTNVPGGRASAATWIDKSGHLWLFGGNGTAASQSGSLSDMWEFDPAAKEWTWMGGSTAANQAGVYGTVGVASSSNLPGGGGGFANCTACVDSSGNFWLYDASALWKFNPTVNQWAWMSGSSSANASAVYGTLGIPSTTNAPGTRMNASAWMDSTGNFWLFGGQLTAGVYNGTLNDLWKFDPTSSQWTWISGSNPFASGVNQPSTYGSEGVPSTSNTPGGRESSSSWTDTSGNLWLYGGASIPTLETGANINELWEFTPNGKMWTWMGGGSTTSLSAIYGTLGSPSSSNTPGARAASVSWVDNGGNLWLFGGVAPAAPGTYGFLNDLWRYQP